MTTRSVQRVTPEELRVSLQALIRRSRKLLAWNKKAKRISTIGCGIWNNSEILSLWKLLESSEKDLHVSAETYSRLWCRSYTAKLYRSVPAREIRDIIYTHLLSDNIMSNDVLVEHHIVRFQRPTTLGFVNGPYSPNCANSNLVPHIFKDSFMGSQFAEEIIQAFHEKGCMSLNNCRDLDKVLEVGPLRRNINHKPYEFIRRLKVTLTTRGAPWTPLRQLTYSWGSDNREMLIPETWFRHQVEYLNSCFKLTHVHILKLHIKLVIMSQTGLDKFEEALVPVVYKLKALGAEIVVEPAYNCAQANWTSKFDYDKPLSDWEKKIRLDSVFISTFERACSGIPMLFGEEQTYWPDS